MALLAIIFLACGTAGCSGPALVKPSGTGDTSAVHAATPVPIRFLLSFDDGPAASGPNSPTLSILADLADNPLQPGIKALFFLQTRAARAGGSALGRQIMQREADAGHVLGFHTATAGHSNHRTLAPAALEQSLSDGSADIRAVAGTAPILVRPPYWNYDARTLAAYRLHGMHMLLTDLSANDGKIWGVNFSLRRRSSLLHQLDAVRRQIAAGALPAIDGAIPVIVTFHDINPYTARHMREYLQILLDSAQQLDLRTAARPFYDDRAELERAALARTVDSASLPMRLPGLWNWIWN